MKFQCLPRYEDQVVQNIPHGLKNDKGQDAGKTSGKKLQIYWKHAPHIFVSTKVTLMRTF